MQDRNYRQQATLNNVLDGIKLVPGAASGRGSYAGGAGFNGSLKSSGTRRALSRRSRRYPVARDGHKRLRMLDPDNTTAMI
jgi:hypothetical protein